MSNVILPKLNVRIIPDIADIPGIIWAAGLVYAMVKYRFLAITPAMAADNILSTMSDSLIILDSKGKILQVNQATRDLLGYHDDEIKNRPFSDILKSRDKGEKIVLDFSKVGFIDEKAADMINRLPLQKVVKRNGSLFIRTMLKMENQGKK